MLFFSTLLTFWGYSRPVLFGTDLTFSTNKTGYGTMRITPVLECLGTGLEHPQKVKSVVRPATDKLRWTMCPISTAFELKRPSLTVQTSKPGNTVLTLF